MAENSKIEWCTHTHNFWMGCTKVGPPCDHCYAEDMMDHRYGRVKWGSGQPRVRTKDWSAPFKWNRDAEKEGRTDVTVFALSLGDIWDNEVDPTWRRDAFDIMRTTPFLTWLLLSKRIGNAVDMALAAGGLPQNAALGATMADQNEWDRDVFKLVNAGKRLDAKFTFASVEPMLGPIDHMVVFPDWVIVGGESGKHARPVHPQWVRSVRDQCDRAGVPFLWKQWGEWVSVSEAEGRGDHYQFPDGTTMRRVGKKKAGRTLDGIIHDGMPACISGGLL